MNARLPATNLLPGPPTMIGCGAAPGAEVPPPERVGFKAHNLIRMARLGLPVPPAFVLDTAWCLSPQPPVPADWLPAMATLEAASDAVFGDPRRPLFLSVRSGAPVSMPGMMETVLNIGLTEDTLPGLVRATGNPRLAWDAYRRLIAGYGEIVLGVPAAVFEDNLQHVAGGRDERELDFAELRSLARLHLETLARDHGRPFPQDPRVQLQDAIGAVLASWHGDKARTWRRMNQLSDTMGTAVTVQRMVFGNGGGRSGAGVGFTRDPRSGEPTPWVDFLFNAQGEDVVSGRRSAAGHAELASAAPAVWSELLHAVQQLEQGFGDMQDFEFTVEEGRLWLLQTRNGKRSPEAQARIALDMCDEGLIDPALARERTQDIDDATLTGRRVVSTQGEALAPLARATPASQGVAIGEIALDEGRARQRREAGAQVLLLRQEAETADIAALELATGLLTARGARTSHAAVVARQLGKVCLVGCGDLQIDLPRRQVCLAGQPMAEGEVLTLDGNDGAVYAGVAGTEEVRPIELLQRLARLRDTA